MKSGDQIKLTKRVEEAHEQLGYFELEASHHAPDESAMDAIRDHLTLVEPTLSWGASRSMPGRVRTRLPNKATRDPAMLEGVLKAATRALSHSNRARYKVRFEGPSDNRKVAEYYGWDN